VLKGILLRNCSGVYINRNIPTAVYVKLKEWNATRAQPQTLYTTNIYRGKG